MSVVIDTDVASFIFKRDTRAALYKKHLVGVPQLISFMTLAEMRRWTFERNWGEAKRGELEEFLGRYGVIYADDELCTLWAKAVDMGRKNGRPIAAADAWVAAVALLFAVPLVTHNYTHFKGIDDLTVISEVQ